MKGTFGAMDGVKVRDLVQQKLAEDMLPSDAPDKTLIGPGGGRPCCACAETIDSDQIQHELRYPDQRVHRMHDGCAALFERARRLLRRPA